MKNKNNTYTTTSFNHCFPVNETKAKSELDNLDRILNDLKKEAKSKKQFFKI